LVTRGIARPPRSTPFPYTTLFRSRASTNSCPPSAATDSCLVQHDQKEDAEPKPSLQRRGQVVAPNRPHDAARNVVNEDRILEHGRGVTERRVEAAVGVVLASPYNGLSVCFPPQDLQAWIVLPLLVAVEVVPFLVAVPRVGDGPGARDACHRRVVARIRFE